MGGSLDGQKLFTGQKAKLLCFSSMLQTISEFLWQLLYCIFLEEISISLVEVRCLCNIVEYFRKAMRYARVPVHLNFHPISSKLIGISKRLITKWIVACALND